MTSDRIPPGLPDDPELGELRGRLRGQWKAERRAEEREAVREHWLQRDRIDAVTKAMHRGDHLTLTLPGNRTLSGQVVATGRDYVLLRERRSPGRECAVRLTNQSRDHRRDPYAGPHIVLRIHDADAASPSPSSRSDAPATFQAVLHQFDFEQQAHPQREIELGTVFHPQGLVCRLQAHAWDHLYAIDRTGHRLFIPAGCITYIAWAGPDEVA